VVTTLHPCQRVPDRRPQFSRRGHHPHRDCAGKAPERFSCHYRTHLRPVQCRWVDRFHYRPLGKTLAQIQRRARWRDVGFAVLWPLYALAPNALLLGLIGAAMGRPEQRGTSSL
jgi:hypothetical protein